MAIVLSHTHCQAAPANANVSIPRTVKNKLQPTDEEEARCANSLCVAIADEMANRSSVLLRNFVLNGPESSRNPLLHIHTKR